MMSHIDGLNERQKEFARLLAQGVKKAKAYRKVFDCQSLSASSVNSAACRLSKNVNVLNFIAQLDEPRDESARMGRTERMAMLAEMAAEARSAGDVRAAVACIAELNKMEGAYAAEAAAAARDDAFREAILRGTAEPLVRL